jgi:hypothetical protein
MTFIGQTISFADPASEIFGQARLFVSEGTRQLIGHALVIVFAKGRVVTSVHTSEEGPEIQSSEDTVAVGSLQVSTLDRLTSWSASFAGQTQGEGAFQLRFDALYSPAHFDLSDRLGDAVSQPSLEQPCAVKGRVMIDGSWIDIQGPGQIGRSDTHDRPVLAPLTREVDAWVADRLAICVRAARPSDVTEHDGEAIDAFLYQRGCPEPTALDEVRLSTAYDGAGLQQRAGLEMWPLADSDYARRAGGEMLCSHTLQADLAGPGYGDSDQDLTPTASKLQWQCAFLHWNMEGQSGIGTYSILREI